jgi:hypothetical protein
MTETPIQPESKVMPVEIRRAVSVLWLSLLLAAIATAVQWLQIYLEDPVSAVVDHILAWVFFALLIWKISQGRGWARITWLFAFVVGWLLTVLFALFSNTYRAVVFHSPFSEGIGLVQVAIQFYATVLLFTSNGRTWFLQKR